MVSSCSIWSPIFKTVFVFDVRLFLLLSVKFFGFNGNFNGKMTKINKMANKMVILIQKILFLQLLHGFKLFHLVPFPIEISIEAEKFYGQQKEGSYIKKRLF